MPSMFFILGMSMLFMFVFIATKDLGYAKPLLSFSYIGLWLYCMFEAIGMYRQSRPKRKSSNDTQSEYRKQIRGRPNYEDRSYSDRISGGRY